MKPGKNKLVRNVDKCNAVDLLLASGYILSNTRKYHLVMIQMDSGPNSDKQNEEIFTGLSQNPWATI